METKNEKEMENGADPRPDETLIIYGLILRMPLEHVPEVKKALASVPGVEVVYQKRTIKWLRITEVEHPLAR